MGGSIVPRQADTPQRGQPVPRLRWRIISAFVTVVCLCAAVIINACSGGGSSYPLPGVGQWVSYGGNEPAINGNSFAFPGPNAAAGYFYTQLPVVPKVGQTLTLDYSVDGNNPVWQNAPNGGDSGAPTLHLFLWRKGDDLACTATTDHYRQFAARTPLVLGDNQTVSAVLDPSQWIVCLGGVSGTLADFNDVLNNLAGAGFVFGGQYYAGHGIYLSSGTATFKINSFAVQ